jgi:hypothetical protein
MLTDLSRAQVALDCLNLLERSVRIAPTEHAYCVFEMLDGKAPRAALLKRLGVRVIRAVPAGVGVVVAAPWSLLQGWGAGLTRPPVSLARVLPRPASDFGPLATPGARPARPIETLVVTFNSLTADERTNVLELISGHCQCRPGPRPRLYTFSNGVGCVAAPLNWNDRLRLMNSFGSHGLSHLENNSPVSPG